MSANQAHRILFRLRMFLIYLILMPVAAILHPAHVLAAASSNDSAAPAPSADITITADGFQPATITVTVGVQVTWHNQSSTSVRLSDQPFSNDGPANFIYLPQVSAHSENALVQQQLASSSVTNSGSEPLAPNGQFTRTFVGSGPICTMPATFPMLLVRSSYDQRPTSSRSFL